MQRICIQCPKDPARQSAPSVEQCPVRGGDPRITGPMPGRQTSPRRRAKRRPRERRITPRTWSEGGAEATTRHPTRFACAKPRVACGQTPGRLRPNPGPPARECRAARSIPAGQSCDPGDPEAPFEPPRAQPPGPLSAAVGCGSEPPRARFPGSTRAASTCRGSPQPAAARQAFRRSCATAVARNVAPVMPGNAGQTRRSWKTGGLGRPGGHSEGQNTRSHPELGRENPQRRWYCASRRGRVGRRQARQNRPSQPTRQPAQPYRGVEQPGSSSGS